MIWYIYGNYIKFTIHGRLYFGGTKVNICLLNSMTHVITYNLSS